MSSLSGKVLQTFEPRKGKALERRFGWEQKQSNPFLDVLQKPTANQFTLFWVLTHDCGTFLLLVGNL